MRHTILRHQQWDAANPMTQYPNGRHAQEIIELQNALANCIAQTVRCRNQPVWIPVEQPETTYDKIKDFAKRVYEEGLDAEQAAEQFLQDNPGIAWTIIGLGVVGILILIADDATLAGIADDFLIPIIGTLIRVAWRFAI